MKKILVIGGSSEEAEDTEELLLFVKGVQEAYPKANVESIALDQLQFIIEPGSFKVLRASTGAEINDADLIILRNKMRTYAALAYSLSRYCELNQVTFFNDYSAYFAGTKLVQAVSFYEQKLPFLKTVYAKGQEALAASIRQELSLPFVLKDALGAKGSSNYLVNSFEELQERLTHEPDIDFLAQEYCPNDCDYRILIAAEKHLIFKRQGSAGTHLNNISTGGSAAPAGNELPEKVIAQAHQLAKAMHLTIAGVDVMPRLGTDSFYFLETNSQPQLFTGALLPQKQKLFAELLDQILS